MAVTTCPNCRTVLTETVRFCPQCGHGVCAALVCKSCQHQNPSNAKFCQQCGAALVKSESAGTGGESQALVLAAVIGTDERPPSVGITIEFPYSTAQTFSFALASAKKFSRFRQLGEGRKARYWVTINPAEMDSVAELLDHLKDWRRRTAYVNGEKVTWESVFSFAFCYETRRSSFKPEFYCLGYQQEYQFNIWGCIHTKLPFTEYARWFCWGEFLNDQGDWKFDKERIRHELQRVLYPYRFCPALRPELIEDALSALPDVVNPLKDKNWKFVENNFDLSSPGLVISLPRGGYRDKVRVKGVSPNGGGALSEIARRMRLRLPKPPGRGG